MYCSVKWNLWADINIKYWLGVSCTLEMEVCRAGTCATADSGTHLPARITPLCVCGRRVCVCVKCVQYVSSVCVCVCVGSVWPTSRQPLVMAACTQRSVPVTSSYTSADHTAQLTWIHSSTLHGNNRPGPYIITDGRINNWAWDLSIPSEWAPSNLSENHKMVAIKTSYMYRADPSTLKMKGTFSVK